MFSSDECLNSFSAHELQQLDALMEEQRCTPSPTQDQIEFIRGVMQDPKQVRDFMKSPVSYSASRGVILEHKVVSIVTNPVEMDHFSPAEVGDPNSTAPTIYAGPLAIVEAVAAVATAAAAIVGTLVLLQVIRSINPRPPGRPL